MNKESQRKHCSACGLHEPCKVCSKTKLAPVCDRDHWTRENLVGLAEDAYKAGRDGDVRKFAELLAHIVS